MLVQPYDFLSLVPVIEGAGGSITDWRGDKLHWPVTAKSQPTSILSILLIKIDEVPFGVYGFFLRSFNPTVNTGPVNIDLGSH